MPRQAAASMPIWAGSGTACSDGSTIDAAAVPKGRRHWPFQTQTRSPTREGETPSPTCSISPAPSLCGMTRGNAILRVKPARLFTSEGIDAGDGKTHPDLAASRLRRLHFADAQDLASRSVGLVVGGAHACPLDGSFAPAHDDIKCAARRSRPPFHLSRRD